MKRILSAVTIGVLTAASVLAADPLKKLASIHDFAFGGIGAAGIPSEGELAFKEVLKRASADKDFLDLLSTGNPQSQCYALVGLHHLDPKAYAGQAARFEHDKTRVNTIAGCIIMAQPMASVAANISSGRYELYLKPK